MTPVRLEPAALRSRVKHSTTEPLRSLAGYTIYSDHLCNIIQLMHSFEVNIRICQPENSDVHLGEAAVNITFEGRLILMLTEKECTNFKRSSNKMNKF